MLSKILHENGELSERVEKALKILENCTLCPRNCKVDRISGERGVCASGRYARIASYGPHFGEEQPLVGKNGSGTIFFASCNLHCCFCQNFDISHYPEDCPEADARTLAGLMIELQGKGCHNINFVTPTHFVPQILEALPIAIEQGLLLPLVYNCSGYEKPETLKLLELVIDIYMPDFKFWTPGKSRKYADAPDYPEAARESLLEMHRQTGDLEIDDTGCAIKGVLVRHLVMPGMLEDTENILRFISHSVSRSTYINIMDQYRPCGRSGEHPELMRSITTEEFGRAKEYAARIGLTRLDQRDLPGILRRLGF